MSHIKLDYLYLIAYCTLIYWLSGQKSLPAPQWFSFQDKIHHAAAYAGMAFFSWRSLRHFIQSSVMLAVAVIVFCSFYGASDEWHQSFVPGRDASAGDWLADTLGAGMAVALMYKLRVMVLKDE